MSGVYLVLIWFLFYYLFYQFWSNWRYKLAQNNLIHIFFCTRRRYEVWYVERILIILGTSPEINLGFVLYRWNWLWTQCWTAFALTFTKKSHLLTMVRYRKRRRQKHMCSEKGQFLLYKLHPLKCSLPVKFRRVTSHKRNTNKHSVFVYWVLYYNFCYFIICLTKKLCVFTIRLVIRIMHTELHVLFIHNFRWKHFEKNTLMTPGKLY